MKTYSEITEGIKADIADIADIAEKGKMVGTENCSWVRTAEQEIEHSISEVKISIHCSEVRLVEDKL